jgi:hypothetical protein
MATSTETMRSGAPPTPTFSVLRVAAVDKRIT